MEIFILLQKALQYEFMQKALVCGILISICASLLGVFLVLRKYSLISDSLSHVSFATVAIALLFGLSPLLVSIPLVIMASLLITKLTEKAHLYSDSAIGLVSASSVAIGVMIISLSKGFNVDIYSYLFGSILAINNLEVILSICISFMVVSVILIYSNDLFLISYDEDFARVSKINIKWINILFSVLQSITIVIGVRIVGALLISSLIIFPAITSLQIARNFRFMLLLSVVISITSVILGIFLSFLFNVPTGATIVVVNSTLFLLFFVINKAFKLK
jgi:zinc transport system permease protein